MTDSSPTGGTSAHGSHDSGGGEPRVRVCMGKEVRCEAGGRYLPGL